MKNDTFSSIDRKMPKFKKVIFDDFWPKSFEVQKIFGQGVQNLNAKNRKKSWPKIVK